jgi:hypothetical protein
MGSHWGERSGAPSRLETLLVSVACILTGIAQVAGIVWIAVSVFF